MAMATLNWSRIGIGAMCLGVANERHLRRVLLEYVAYYNATRPHRTLELETPEGPRSVLRHGQVVSIPVLAGIHHRYEREAA